MIPDISNWETIQINDMSYIFYGCKLLMLLPDISKWDISNVTNIKYIFYECKSLLSLPDISKWNASKDINMSYMFYGCKSLLSLPDISKWGIDLSQSKDIKNYLLLSDDEFNEIKIKQNKLRIFGNIFVKNNKDKCKIIYNNIEYDLKEYFEEIDNNYNKKDLITFELKISKRFNNIRIKNK